MIRRYAASLFAALLITLALSSSSLSADVIDDIVSASLMSRLIDRGMDEKEAAELSRQYSFFCSMMIVAADMEPEDLIDAAETSGRAMGEILCASKEHYGSSSISEAASLILLTARAGVSLDVAITAFNEIAASGRSFEDNSAILCEISDTVRSLRPSDRGVSICSAVIEMIADDLDVDAVRRGIEAAAERERAARRAELMAAKRKDLHSGGDADNDRSGGTDRSYDGDSSYSASDSVTGDAVAAGTSDAASDADDASAEPSAADTAGLDETAEAEKEASETKKD